jgi:DNA polymerase-3 subunit epsilon
MSLVFLDTETTGLDYRLHEVWEIAYVSEENHVIRSSFVEHSLKTADPFALELNGYYDRYNHGGAADAYRRAKWELEFRKALEGNTVVAANARFDMNMLFARWGVEPWHYRSLDIEAYAMGALGYDTPKGMKTIYDDLTSLGYELPEPDHTAAGDVATLREAFEVLRSLYSVMA